MYGLSASRFGGFFFSSYDTLGSSSRVLKKPHPYKRTRREIARDKEYDRNRSLEKVRDDLRLRILWRVFLGDTEDEDGVWKFASEFVFLRNEELRKMNHDIYYELFLNPPFPLVVSGGLVSQINIDACD